MKFWKILLSIVLCLALATGCAVGGYTICYNTQVAGEETTNTENNEEDFSVSQAEYDALYATYQELLTTYQQLLEDYQLLSDQYDQLELEKNDLWTMNLQLTEDYEQVCLDYDNLNMDCEDLEQRIQEYEDEIALLEAQVLALQVEIEELSGSGDDTSEMENFILEYANWSVGSYSSCSHLNNDNCVVYSSSEYATDDDHLGLFLFDFSTYTVTRLSTFYCGNILSLTNEYILCENGYKFYLDDYTSEYLGFDFSTFDYYMACSTPTSFVYKDYYSNNISIVTVNGEYVTYVADYSYDICAAVTPEDKDITYFFFTSSETEGMIYCNSSDLQFVELTSTGTGYYSPNYTEDAIYFYDSQGYYYMFDRATYEFSLVVVGD